MVLRNSPGIFVTYAWGERDDVRDPRDPMEFRKQEALKSVKVTFDELIQMDLDTVCFIVEYINWNHKDYISLELYVKEDEEIIFYEYEYKANPDIDADDIVSQMKNATMPEFAPTEWQGWLMTPYYRVYARRNSSFISYLKDYMNKPSWGDMKIREKYFRFMLKELGEEWQK